MNEGAETGSPDAGSSGAVAPEGASGLDSSGVKKRPRVKICGVTRASDIELAVDLGAELIGLNFYPPSPRYVTPEQAAELIRRVGRRRATWVGVFVNEPVQRMTEIAELAGLDLLQFHGDESPKEVRPVAPRAIKALRVADEASPGLLDPWLDLGLWGLLIDAHHETLYGGSGHSWNFASTPGLEGGAGDGEAAVRLLVAGGLGPDNARAAVRAARPWGIDLASGVESSPGIKDSSLLKKLFTQFNEEMPHGETPTAA